MFGKTKLYIMESLNKERGMGMEYGGQGTKIMILLKDNMRKITKMAMEYIHGLMGQFIKAHSKMI